MDDLKQEFVKCAQELKQMLYREMQPLMDKEQFDEQKASKLLTKLVGYHNQIVTAAVAAEREWISVEDKKIPLNEFIICGLWVDDTEKDYSYFDEYYIYFDDEFEPRDKWDNYLSEWEYDDFTHWKLLPDPPESDAIRVRGGGDG